MSSYDDVSAEFNQLSPPSLLPVCAEAGALFLYLRENGSRGAGQSDDSNTQAVHGLLNQQQAAEGNPTSTTLLKNTAFYLIENPFNGFVRIPCTFQYSETCF